MSSVPLSARVAAPISLDAPAAIGGITWRPASIQDAPAIHACEKALAVADHPRHTMRLAEIDEKLTASYVDPELDSIVAIDEQGVVRAWGIALLLPSQETLVRCRLVGGVAPSHRGRGIGRVLLAWLRDRGLQRLASTQSTLPGWLVVPVDGAADQTQRLCARLGFTVARTFLELARSLSDAVEAGSLDGLAIEQFSPERSEATRLADIDAFRDHWASQPTTEQEWRSMVDGDTFRADLSFVAVGTDDQGGEVVAGLVMATVNEEDWSGRGFSFVYIAIVGVPRSWRGRGIANVLLARTLESAAAAGLDYAILDVDSENPSGALRLYTNLGFQPSNSTLTYTSEY